MQKRAPTLGNILVIVLFALSCFGLLLFLWESFGGPVPLKPKGYRFTVAFPRTLRSPNSPTCASAASTSATSSALKLGKDGRTHATLEIDQPVRAGAREHARDPAPEDAAGGDLRAADPREPERAVPARRRPAGRQPGRTVGDARRHPLRARPEDAPRLPGVAAVGGGGHRRARRRDQRRLRHARPVRRTRQQAGEHARLPGRGA